ncbi:MAG: Nif3-like dinuclear metal center hexameric protein [Burkholderiales bacterium]|nr:Nif3-like dinuclear metal center hexameric protein [Phycisphaerae bacterium]
MELSQILCELERIAPLGDAESWDNVGLLAGDPAQDVSRAMLCIDYTRQVADEAKSAGVELVVAYHPPIFKPINRLTADGAGQLMFDAIRRGVAIFSPHTALDVADGGTNDVLADIVGLIDRSALRVADIKATQYKLVTFVPRDHIDAVANAIFDAGAGRIGDYSRCSFRSDGTGTFLGNQNTNPAVGQAGKMETADEIRIETVLPIDALTPVVTALRKAHPYEEPAFDLVLLAAPPTGRGIGRVGKFKQPTDRQQIVSILKSALRINHVLVAGPTQGLANSVAICAGAGDDLLDDALASGAEVYITGEVRHHDALRAAEAGMTVICTLHSNSERVTMTKLADRLTQSLPQVAWLVSKADRDPFEIR